MLEARELYDQFHLDEPWDSPHNKALIPLMPAFYLDPSSRFRPSDGRTHYLGAQGQGLFLDGSSKGLEMARIRDGTTNTIAVLQVNDERAAVWTAPDDWQYDASSPLSGLVPPIHPGGFMAAFLDGHIQWFDQTVDPTTLRVMLTVAGRDNP
jgi:prepilin-type processing-associated H-X9-DG protein